MSTLSSSTTTFTTGPAEMGATCPKFRSPHSIPSSGCITGKGLPGCNKSRFISLGADFIPFKNLSNIDRIWAIWQALNPDKWFTEGRLGEFDQKTIGLPEVITNKTPLRPFHKDEHGTTWTPDEVRDLLQFGYSYPELQPWLPEYRSSDGSFSSQSYQSKIFETVNVKYGACRQQALQMLAQAQAGTAPLPGGMTEASEGVSALDYAISVRYSK